MGIDVQHRHCIENEMSMDMDMEMQYGDGQGDAAWIRTWPCSMEIDMQHGQ
jgi:hypothetical protein